MHEQKTRPVKQVTRLRDKVYYRVYHSSKALSSRYGALRYVTVRACADVSAPANNFRYTKAYVRNYAAPRGGR